MAKTENIGLNLTENDSTLFEDWRKSIDGNGSGNGKSNMQIIDEKFGEVDRRLSERVTVVYDAIMEELRFN